MRETRLKFLKNRVAYRIARSDASVFVREDFKELAEYDQIGRALRLLVADGQLMKVGYGLYARAKVSLLSGKLVPAKSLPRLAREALAKLNVETFPSYYEREYNAGRSTQVPTGRVIAVKGRVSRKIGYDGTYVTFEHATD